MFVLFLICAVVIGAHSQECGTVSPTGKEVPWQAGVYLVHLDYNGVDERIKWIRGGSLISSKVIVTAAPSPIYLRAFTVKRYFVAVGKLSRPWVEPVDDITQKSDIKELHHAPGFQVIRGGPYYENDLAVVIVTTPFRYNDYIRPVCISFDYNFEEQIKVEKKDGKAAGWGIVTSEPLRQYNKILSYVSWEACTFNRSTEFYTFTNSFLALNDKICVKAKEPNSAICEGDSGIGLAYSTNASGVDKYYLRGVFSGALDGDICTTETYYGFTLLRKHEGFIRKYWNETSEEVPKQIGKCSLPSYPEFGTYSTNVTRTKVSGGEDFIVVALTVTCDRGYGVTGPSSISCFNGFWPEKVLPSCVRMCQLKRHHSVDYRCLVSGDVVGSRDCRDHEAIGTIVSPRCREPHYYSPNTLNFMRCKDDGQWDYIAKCSPECGRVTPDGKELVVGGTKVKRGELPWHAGIYRTDSVPYMQICGGSIISDTLIISAAHCFWTSLDKQLPPSLFAVAVGKIYRPWNDMQDEPQKSAVKTIHIPTRYQGAGASFQDDIAVVIITTPLQFKPHIRPVCLSFDSNFDRLQLQTINKGKVAGWGLTAANGKASPVLRVLEMPYVEVGTCIADSPSDFGEYITSDKICAGTLQNNSALCRGDSGGGLAFPATDRGVERHYLRGVVSTAPSSNKADNCNTDTYTSFTHITKHEDFIKPFLTES